MTNQTDQLKQKAKIDKYFKEFIKMISKKPYVDVLKRLASK